MATVSPLLQRGFNSPFAGVAQQYGVNANLLGYKPQATQPGQQQRPRAQVFTPGATVSPSLATTRSNLPADAQVKAQVLSGLPLGNFTRATEGASRILDARSRVQDAANSFNGITNAITGVRFAKDVATGTGGKLINTIAGKLPGVTSGAPLPAGVHGPVQPAGILQGTSFSAAGILAGAGLGFTVGSLNPLAEKELGSQVGGTIGGAAGSVFGPVGSLVGGFLGSTIGGFFGGTPHPEASFGLTIDQAGGFKEKQGPVFLSKHIGTEYAQGLQSDFTGFTTSLSSDIGLKFKDTFTVHGGVNTEGGFTEIATKDTREKPLGRIYFDEKKGDEASKALAKVSLELIDTSAIKNAKLVGEIEELKKTSVTMQEVYNRLSKYSVTTSGGDPVDIEAVIGPKIGSIKKVNTKTAIAQKQFEDYLEKAKEGKVGRASTILTGPQGVTEPAPLFKRRLIGGIPDESETDLLGV